MADKENMIDVLRKFPAMLESAAKLGEDMNFQKEFVESIVVIGMGGSGYTGDLLKAYLNDVAIPVHVVKNYNLPKFIGRKSLIFAISYSGNTEETISAYRTAIRRGCNIISISSGGKLKELAELNKNPHISIPGGIQPRLSTPYLFISVLNVLSYSGIIEDQGELVKKCVAELESSAGSIEKTGKELAGKYRNKIPIIYSAQEFFCIAEKWKTDINENAKTHAFYNVLPEFNHNEICAYQYNQEIFKPLILSYDDYHPKIKKRIGIFRKLLKEYKVPVAEVNFVGNTLLARLFSSIWMGLFFAYYLAMEYDRDPTPVEIIEKLKKDLK
ncbi:TPA: bifunctional phosphoglucose/phosphomannose isomerase [Candidatus Woesearchaeota archaeon]|nr:Bifunctional phosphoglucose/phosphomannose isomerase [archaeon GW2011_AR15]MBS3104501.1 bifunctional phosphoglucose/phosphomannose isomerase [Candidatus Woesearchaeota archaeon]HIH41185.1 bifunctional phosphoglucose/phosphomannose isomerase [Candidatus Woesearchaeota archaeon]